ncbi:MAG: hypothetical protein CVU65_15230 [Deltaproteobacteria bacterium HGW-Deltaproteobacteria-22]|nr:MAG: hypothetical protein CVU65_15230 [Deltaproteobacteria bacterium HGW-Deltaproteobacteria-22]
MSDNDNIDLKARLGRKRLRTSSQKDLESNLPGAEQGYERPPTGEFRAASDEGIPTPMGMPSIPAPGMPSVPGAPMPAATPVEIDYNIGKTSKMTYIILAACCVLPSLGLGYCSGQRVEQNNLVNKATKDAASLKATFDLINMDLGKFQTAFAAPPTKVAGWLTLPQDLSIKDPDFGELAGFKLNYIPTPKQRKDFMGNLVTFYSLIILIKDEYGRFQEHVMALDSFKDIVNAMDKMEEKQIVAEGKSEYLLNIISILRKYTIKTVQGRSEAAVKDAKDVQKFVLLWDGATTKTIVIPLQIDALVCPEAKKAKCEEYEKVVSYLGQEFPFEMAKDVKAAEMKVAIKFGEVAQRSMEVMVKSEIVDPMVPRWQNAVDSFYKLQKYIKDANEIAAKLMPILDGAAKRKKRGLI